MVFVISVPLAKPICSIQIKCYKENNTLEQCHSQGKGHVIAVTWILLSFCKM